MAIGPLNSTCSVHVYPATGLPGAMESANPPGPHLRSGRVAAFAGFFVFALATNFSFCRADDGRIEFNRQIRPLLSDRCFRCHGPDARQRKGDLRLDTDAGARAKRDGGSAIVRGKPDE